MSNEKIKVAPNSKEAEMMVLGCMLTSINSLNVGSESLDDTDFYYTEHQILFQVMKQSFMTDKPVDLFLVCEELKRQDRLRNVGGAGYVATVAQYAGTSAHIESYINIVQGKSIYRRMINAAQTIQKNAIEESDDVLASLDEAQKLLFEIGQGANSRSGVFIGQVLSGSKTETKQNFLKEIQDRQEKFIKFGYDKTIQGIQSHFHDLDKMLNGLGNSNLIVLAARPAMGKTALAINIAENICFKGNMPVGIFSLEMSAEQLVHRIVCSQAEVESDKIKTGSINGQDYQRIVETVQRIQNCPLIIDDQPGLKITDIRARARRMKEAYDVKLIVIDYLQLISGSGTFRNTENRQIEVSEISRMLKNLARELNIPILCLSQLSRKVEERMDKRPLMSDLRESGSIEQDSDVVMFLLRQDYYDRDMNPGKAELIVAKNRHGSIGCINLLFRDKFAQFGNLMLDKHVSYDKHNFAD